LPTFDASPAISQDPESARFVLNQTLRAVREINRAGLKACSFFFCHADL
jgi:hypothetical protein